MGVKLVSSGGGSVEINPPATASNFVATMPAGTGNVVVNGINGSIVSGTAVASTSGTSIDFTSIPSWVRRITVMFAGVSTNGTSVPQVQLGSGSFTTSGYLGSSSYIVNSVATTTATSGLFVAPTGFWAAATTINGFLVISLQNSSTNTWCGTGSYGTSNTATMYLTGGAIALSGTLDRVRITTVNGTDTFDAGSINILYE
jgi:hypothetical protein